MNKMNRIFELINSKKLDGIMVSKSENRQYLSGFTGTTGIAIITKDKKYFITDFRYIDQAKEQCIGYEILENTKEKKVTDIINSLDLKRLGFEDDFMTYEQFKSFDDKLESIELIPLERELINIRSIKDKEEIEFIEKAASIADNALKDVLPKIKPGAIERDIALELEYNMKKQGASQVSFDIIVASGLRSSLPHGVASEKVIEDGDFITIDFGCVYKGYCSDMTRAFVVGKSNEKQREIYNIVLEAQVKALESVRPGVTGKQLDEIARDIIEKAGYGDCFGHGLGHGVGLEVHELPHISSLGTNELEEGMIITIEPGIYVSGFGGVRIEDLIEVTKDGYKVLSNFSKEFKEI